CKKSFSRSSRLTEHLRTYTGKRPFACGNCEKTFTHNSSLTMHLRTHTAEKP
ncbi:Zinc finger and SCAN domain-containing protein 32, partial [Pterocles gutturalis]